MIDRFCSTSSIDAVRVHGDIKNYHMLQGLKVDLHTYSEYSGSGDDIDIVITDAIEDTEEGSGLLPILNGVADIVKNLKPIITSDDEDGDDEISYSGDEGDYDRKLV